MARAGGRLRRSRVVWRGGDTSRYSLASGTKRRPRMTTTEARTNSGPLGGWMAISTHYPHGGAQKSLYPRHCITTDTALRDEEVGDDTGYPNFCTARYGYNIVGRR